MIYRREGSPGAGAAANLKIIFLMYNGWKEPLRKEAIQLGV